MKQPRRNDRQQQQGQHRFMALLMGLLSLTVMMRETHAFVPGQQHQHKDLLSTKQESPVFYRSTNAFGRSINTLPTSTTTSLTMIYRQEKGQRRGGGGRTIGRDKFDRSKRQERVGQLVQSELARIIHTGNLKGDADYLDAELRKRISVVKADVSPDLRQARITVSIRKGSHNHDDDRDDRSSAAVDRRRAFSWLVENTKPLRHTLAQRMSHMKTAPNLSFAQVDVGAAVDVMYLIDKVSTGYKRDNIGAYGGGDDSLPRGVVGGYDFDEEEGDEDDWEDGDFEFFNMSGEGTVDIDDIDIDDIDIEDED